MHRIHVPFIELVCRLIKLNQDRLRGYKLFGTLCKQKAIRSKCHELAEQSSKNITELQNLITNYSGQEENCPSFTVSPELWKSLQNSGEKYDVHFIASIIYKIEEQFSILYKFVCNMFDRKDDNPQIIIVNQYEQLLKSKSQIPHLLLHFN